MRSRIGVEARGRRRRPRGMHIAASIVMIRSTALALAALAACGGSNETRQARTPGAETRTTVTTSAISDVEARAAATPGSLSERHVRRRVSEQMPAVRAECGDIPREIDRYETTLHLEIGASGAVEVARARGNHPMIDACVADVARSWHFDASSGRTIANVPLTMSRTDNGSPP